jgi:gliding motility-associated lipoprotein GldH
MYCNNFAWFMRQSTFPFWVVLLWLASISFSGCRPVAVFEKNTPIPNQQWSNNFAAEAAFTITDTLSAYNIYIVLRHTDAYGYNNIWLNVGQQSPGDSMYFQKVDLLLGTDAQGWKGTGLNDIWELREPIVINKRFRKPGDYQFKVYQVMRDNPLRNVLSAGIRVEKLP